MAKGSVPEIEDILKNSDKAEILEKLSDALSIEGCKVVIITGKPNDSDGLDIVVLQTGFRYAFEEHGFIMEGAKIVEDYDNEEAEI